MLFTRTILERNEALTLAGYASLASASRGRIYIEDESEYRTAFQKDRDRVIHTSAFRRLKYKTQVFANYEGDYYRTRLTHTLEVAQVSKSIARALGLNEDLTETIALAHDLGHPPYGHAGERTLNRLAKDSGGFDHNKQSLRVVTELEQRYPEFPGLNLTWETLEGMMKHETKYTVPDSKWEPDPILSLEAQVVNLADELTYNAHDLDDGLRSGILNAQQIAEISLIAELMQSLNISTATFSSQNRYALIREFLGLMIGDTVRSTHQNLEAQTIKTIHDVAIASHTLVNTSETLKEQLKELQQFLYQHFYFNYRLLRMTKKADHILERIFEAYIVSPKMLPDDIKKHVELRGLERTVIDYLASMTDRYVADEYSRLFDPHAKTS